MAYLLVSRVSSYREDEVRPAVSDMLDRSGLEWRGKTVLVKPNLLGPFTPQSGVVTHPCVIRSLRDELRRRGCRVMVGDNPGIRGYGMVGRMARVSGAEEAAGEDLVNLGLRPRQVAIDSRHVRRVSVCSEVFEADLWISVPKFKTHMTTVITGAVKNSYGLLVGGEKARLHAAAPRPWDFGELLVDLYALRPPDLVIMDAVVGMEGNGPSGGKLRDIGVLLSSRSGGVIDLAMCRMAGIDPARVPTQAWATRRGLAPDDLEAVEVLGELPVIPRFRKPSTMARLDPGGAVQKLIFRSLSRPRLGVNRKRCTGCGSCVRGCPVQAISLHGYPRFDAAKCIACYCCHELCPEGAVKVGGMVAFLRG
ncbi:MAG: DUF362 domain-containing protein [Actinobacteria bacterium]|nr:DUF362 domain-containing protein [Actinomycetota bacterium]